MSRGCKSVTLAWAQPLSSQGICKSYPDRSATSVKASILTNTSITVDAKQRQECCICDLRFGIHGLPLWSKITNLVLASNDSFLDLFDPKAIVLST